MRRRRRSQSFTGEGTMDLNALRGRGEGSSMNVLEDDLPEGWKFERISSPSARILSPPTCTQKLKV